MNGKTSLKSQNRESDKESKPKITKVPKLYQPEEEIELQINKKKTPEPKKNPETENFLNKKDNTKKTLNSQECSSTVTPNPRETVTRGRTSAETLKEIAKKKAKTCCCSSWIFFSEFEYLFYIGQKRYLTKEDMAPLPPGIRSDTVKGIAMDIWDQLDKKAENEEIEFLKKNRESMYFKKKPKSKKVKDIFTIIYKMIRPKMRNAIILKAIENVIILGLSFLLRTFVPEVKKDAEKRDNYLIFICPVIAGILAFIRYTLKEHSAKFVNQSGSMSGQTLRTLLFHKIVNSNLSFLRNADESIVTKIVLFDLDIVLGYIGKLPDLFSFPIIFSLSVAMMVYFISFTTLITFAVFIVAWLILIFVTKRLAVENNKYKYFGSKRATVVSELISKMKTMKSNSMEMFLEQKLSILRDREMACLKSVKNYRSVANFIMSLTPFFSILIILLLERNLRGVSLDVTTTFTIVSIIASLNKPLRRFVNILDRYYDYKEAKQGLNNLLFLIPDKPNHPKNDRTLKPGWVEAINCEAQIEIDESMKKNLKKIFGENLDVEKELAQYTRRNHRKHSYVFRTSKTRIEEEKKQNMDDSYSSDFQQTSNFVQKKKLFKKVSVTIFPKTKVGIVGDPGSGASEFLYTILGETYITQGTVRYRGKVIYQDEDDSSYLENSSIRDNILMGDTMIQDRYVKVLKCVGLNLNNFPGGDQLEVLADGKNLSGSERRKLLLARSLYVSGDIYILEDFFGHDDEESEGRLFKRMIEGMLKFKTLIVKTDAESVLSQVDKIIMFKSGKCKQFHSYEDYSDFLNGVVKKTNNLSKSKISMSNRLGKMGFKNIGKSDQKGQQGEVNVFDKSTLSNIKKKQEKNKFLGRDNNNNNTKIKRGQGYNILSNLMPGIIKIVKKKGEGRQVKEWDESEVYAQSFAKMASRYIFLLGKSRILLQIFLFVISSCLFVTIDIWTGTWSNDILGWDMNSYIVVYLSISVSFSLMVLLRDVIFHRTLVGNAKHIQVLMVKSLLNINLEWIDLYPDTRIDFKLSYDVKKMDSVINTQIHAFIEALVYCIAAGIILNYIYFGAMLLTMILIGVYLYYVMKNYFKTVHSLIEYISENTASLKNVMNQTINEAVQYRSLRTSRLLEKRFLSLTNEMQRAMTHYGFYCGRWIGVRLGWIYTVLIIMAYTVPILFVFSLKNVTSLSLLEIALAISWSLKLVGFFDTMIKSTMRVHKNVVSFGRAENYIKKVETEPTLRKPRIPDIEKIQNVVDIQNLNKSFGTRKVLSDINLKIGKFEKIAVVGSSGAGKHVLMTTLMQIYFRDKDENSDSKLEIMGVNVDKSNPRNIRHSIRYLNRLPITFSGTVRENIDPGYHHSNSKIYNIMEILNAGEILIDRSVREKAEMMNKILEEQSPSFGPEKKNPDFKKTYTDYNHLKEKTSLEFLENFRNEESDEEEEKNDDDQKENITFGNVDGGSPGRRLETGSSRKPLMTEENKNLETQLNNFSIKDNQEIKGNYSSLGVLDHQKNLRTLKKNFLEKELNEKIGEFPIKLRKLLKAVKALLDKPKILIIDQKALDFDSSKNFGEMLKIFTDNLKQTTFFVMVNSFEHILDMDKVMVLNSGTLVEFGTIPSLLLDADSKFKYLMKKADLKVYKNLKEKVLCERNGENNFGQQQNLVTETPTMVSMFQKVNEHSGFEDEGERFGFDRRERGENAGVNSVRDFQVNDNMNRMKTIRSRGGEENEE